MRTHEGAIVCYRRVVVLVVRCSAISEMFVHAGTFSVQMANIAECGGQFNRGRGQSPRLKSPIRPSRELAGRREVGAGIAQSPRRPQAAAGDHRHAGVGRTVPCLAGNSIEMLSPRVKTAQHPKAKHRARFISDDRSSGVPAMAGLGETRCRTSVIQHRPASEQQGEARAVSRTKGSQLPPSVEAAGMVSASTSPPGQ